MYINRKMSGHNFSYPPKIVFFVNFPNQFISWRTLFQVTLEFLFPRFMYVLLLLKAWKKCSKLIMMKEIILKCLHSHNMPFSPEILFFFPKKAFTNYFTTLLCINLLIVFFLSFLLILILLTFFFLEYFFITKQIRIQF